MIVRLNGGLGNQMFQYAFALSLKQKHPECKLLYDYASYNDFNIHNGLEIDRLFNLRLPQAKFSEILPSTWPTSSKMWFRIRKLFPRNKFIVSENNFELLNMQNLNHLYFDGFWQHEQYFSNVIPQIKSLYRCNLQNETPANKDILQVVSDYECVSIHIRRGDYLNHPLYTGICDISYYRRAIEIINGYINPEKYIIFSNDDEWCRQNILKESKKAIYVNWNNGNNSYKDMFLMSKCQHNIIANSSFSWWAAWLNNNNNKMIIAPHKWNNDASQLSPVCKSWMTI